MTASSETLPDSSARWRLRPGFLLAYAASLITGIVGFYGGQWWAAQEAQKKQAEAIDTIVGADNAKNLFILHKALVSLRVGQSTEAENVLLRLAKLNLATVRECQASKKCASWAGSLMPTPAQQMDIETWQERK